MVSAHSAVPFILSYCLMLGVRFAFELPTDLRSNWIFQLCVKREDHECVPLGQTVMLIFVLPWVFAIVCPVYTWVWGLWPGVLHTLIVTCWSVLLSKILLLEFRKVPCTCPFPEFKQAASILALWYVLGCVVFAIVTSQLENLGALSSSSHPSAGRFGGISVRRDLQEVEKQLVFENEADIGFELLNLQRGA